MSNPLRQFRLHINNAENELKLARENLEKFYELNPVPSGHDESSTKYARRKLLWVLKTAEGHTRHARLGIAFPEETSKNDIRQEE